MKDILVTGCTSLLKKNMFDHLREDIRVILADDASAYAEGTKGRVYRYGPEDRSFAQLFDVYSFHTVIYVSGYADGGTGMVNEVLKLEQVLLQSSRAHVDKVIVLSSIESMNYVPVIGNGGAEMGEGLLSGPGIDGGAAGGNVPVFHPDDVFKNCNAAAPVSGGQYKREEFSGTYLRSGAARRKGIASVPGRRPSGFYQPEGTGEIWSEG